MSQVCRSTICRYKTLTMQMLFRSVTKRQVDPQELRKETFKNKVVSSKMALTNESHLNVPRGIRQAISQES